MAPFGVRQYRQLLGGCVSITFVAFFLASSSSILSGHFLGESALTGVSLASPLFTFCSFLTSLIGAGTGINYSLRRGRLDRNGAESVFVQGVWTVLFCGVATASAVWIFRDAFVSLMASDPEVVRCAVDYWRWLPPGLFFMCCSGLLYNCCYCDGDTFFATSVTVAQCVLTLGVSYLSLRVGYGAASCSAGFAAGYLFTCVALSMHFLRRSNTFRFSWRFNLRETLTIVKSSAGDALSFLGDSVLYVVLGCVLSRSFGSAALIGLPVFIFVNEFLSYANGFSSAMQPIVAVYFGERNHRSVRVVSMSVFGSLASVSVLVTVFLLAFPQVVLLALGIDDPSVERVVRILALMVLPLTLTNLFNNYLQLIEREKLAVGLTVFYWFVLPFAMLTLFPVFSGGDGFWFWAASCRWLGVLLFGLFMVWRYGRSRFPLLLDRDREAVIFTFDLRLREIEIAFAAESVARRMEELGVRRERAMRARLLVEESLMVIKERNGDKAVFAEVTLDLNDGIVITMRDDGIIFDITDADARVNGLRTYLVATMMQHQSEKSNILTTGFNRNVFRL